MTGTKSKKKEQFMPYNKSILTRMLFPALQKKNVLVITHFSKKSISKYLRQPIGTGAPISGPARGLFNPILKLGLNNNKRMTKTKVS